MTNSEASRHKNISQRIVQSIEKFWNRHENEDFQVNIDGQTIRCHSFILASCSEFFASLLRSNMKEKLEMKVDLQNIGLEIFQLILRMLYTGNDLLTKDNVLEVWAAVHQLQIDFLIQQCEDLILENLSLETLETYKTQADFLQSKKVSKGVFKYMLEHFMTIRATQAFLRLNFEELLKLIESDSLVVTSEDLVLQSVFEWINFGNSSIPTVNENDATLPLSSRDTSSTEVISHSSKTEESNKEMENVNDSAGDFNKNESTEESQSNGVSNSSLTQASAISSVSQKDGAPSAPSQCQDNPRRVYLLPILKSTRYFLLSETCVANLYRNKLIQNNTQSIEFLFESLAYKTCIHVNGYMPPAAYHRRCSQFENVGLLSHSKNRMCAYSFIQNKWLRLSRSTELNIFKLLVLNNQLYACVNYESASEVFASQNQQWVSVLKLQEIVCLFLPHESHIYIITSENSKVYRFKPISSSHEIDVDIGAIDYAIRFNQNILVFTTSDLKTKVRCWDTDRNRLSHLAELEDFSAASMTSLRDNRSTYILDTLGHLFEVKQLDTVHFIFIDSVWSSRPERLDGSVLFRKTLYLCGKLPEKFNYKVKVKDIYSSFVLLRSGKVEFTSNFISCDILKSDLILP
ncbi:uncharacterized protein LOC106050447 [Biomphalaria glabrata]|uniref:Uncharacterized protein LOC106050447 n=1 Tax=Biomphalaria glabrata TaxID=6526 RepID=A0A9U8DU66_BIOGL|nr:uncharacterized protein LOC106050447 [Biomphalaria glabrata]XP_055896493.1 uncharacterized protein LOC106050447 [Biomphalaria glabrata]XP_055896494.1 uncharacterized protein LOC106050447 [Biomphalaria glabrata]